MAEPSPGSLKEPIQTKLRHLVIATVALWLAIAGLVIWNRIDASKVNTALCELRADQERQVATQEDFLQANPEGIPGISPATIRQGIDNRKRTIEALQGLPCG